MTMSFTDTEIERLTAERELIRDAISAQREENAANVTFDGQTINRLPYDMLVQDEARLTNIINALLLRRASGGKDIYQFGRKIRI